MALPRSHAFLLLVLASFASGLSTNAKAGSDEPYALRGIRLGISLADFKITQPPDRDVWPDVGFLCSDDAEARSHASRPAESAIAVSDGESRAGIVRCGYFHKSANPPVPAGLVVAGVKADVTFVFVPDFVGDLRLARIWVETASSNYDSIRAALLKKYGQPKSKMQGYAYDTSGGKLTDETIKWSNGFSRIQLDQRDEDVDVQIMSIEYSDDALAAEGLKRLKAVVGNTKDTL